MIDPIRYLEPHIVMVDIETTEMIGKGASIDPMRVGLSELAVAQPGREARGLYTDIIKPVARATTGAEAWRAAIPSQGISWGPDIGQPGSVLSKVFTRHLGAARAGSPLVTEREAFIAMMSQFEQGQAFGAFNVSFERRFFSNLARRTGLTEQWAEFQRLHPLIEAAEPVWRYYYGQIAAGELDPLMSKRFYQELKYGAETVESLAQKPAAEFLEPYSALKEAVGSAEEIVARAPESQRAELRSAFFRRLADPGASMDPAEIAERQALGLMPENKGWLELGELYAERETLSTPGLFERIEPEYRRQILEGESDIMGLLRREAPEEAERVAASVQARLMEEAERMQKIKGRRASDYLEGYAGRHPLAEKRISFQYMKGWTADFIRDLLEVDSRETYHMAARDAEFQAELMRNFAMANEMSADEADKLFEQRYGVTLTQFRKKFVDKLAGTAKEEELYRARSYGVGAGESKAAMQRKFIEEWEKRMVRTEKPIAKMLDGKVAMITSETKKIFKNAALDIGNMWNSLPKGVRWSGAAVASLFMLDAMRSERDVRHSMEIREQPYDEIQGIAQPPYMHSMAKIGDYGAISMSAYVTPNGGFVNRLLWEGRSQSRVKNYGLKVNRLYSSQYSTSSRYTGHIIGPSGVSQSTGHFNGSRALLN